MAILTDASQAELHTPFLLALDGRGGARFLDVDVPIDRSAHDAPLLWLHVPAITPGLGSRLQRNWGMSAETLATIAASLKFNPHRRSLVEETGPDQLLLRINLPEPGNDEESPVFCWLTTRFVVTVSSGPRPAIVAEIQQLQAGRGAHDIVGLLSGLAAAGIDFAHLRVLDIEDRVSQAELLAERGDLLTPHSISALHRELMTWRLRLVAQRDVFLQIDILRPRFLDPGRTELHAQSARAAAVLHEIDALGDRARSVLDEIRSRQNTRMQRTLYILTIVSAVFLPLSFLTGLFGVNLGGIPGARGPWAFAALCAFLFILAGLQIRMLRRRGFL